MSLSQRLAKLEEQAVPRTAEDRCPKCNGTDLAEPSDEQPLIVEGWTREEVAQLCLELIPRARLAWCEQCQRLVAVGEQDPRWREAFWNDRQNSGLARHMADVIFLRDVHRSLATTSDRV